MGFQFQAFATIAHLNFRKQGKDQDEVAIDIKFQGEEIPAAWFLPVFGIAAERILHDAFWDTKAPDQPARFINLKGIKLDAEWDGRHSFQLASGLYEDRIEKLKGFNLTPRGRRRFDCEFSLTVLNPKTTLVDYLVEYNKETVRLEITPDPDLFDQDDSPHRLADASQPSETDSAKGGDDDPLVFQAAAWVRENNKASISALQRGLKVSYNRAARLMQALEARGIASARKPNGSRDVITVLTKEPN